ncbi:MAG: exopolysaccharide biosynthesis polyprenyl glycosylphosphotransferase [Clostridia bacterium]|nr:exopolysaccharide biosynthesis polyprenyl glycosylphosphotransferase [Clostridia bacterium]
MQTNRKRSIEKILTIVYVFLHGAAFYTVWKLIYSSEVHEGRIRDDNIILTFLYLLMICFVAKSLDGFRVNSNNKFALFVSHTITAVIADVVTYGVLLVEFRKYITPVPMLMVFGMNMVISTLWILIGKTILERHPARKCVLFYYDEKDVRYLKEKLDQSKNQFEIIGVVKIDSDKIPEGVFGEKVHTAVIAYMPGEFRNELMKYCFDKDIDVIFTPKVSDVLIRGARELDVIDRPLLEINCSSMTLVDKFVKRAFDIFSSGLALILLSPVFAVTALAIKLQDGGPVFYKQKRCTLDGREFEIYKFRSMIVDAEKNNKAVLAAKNDTRITKVGAFIRATRIDELPQLINILKGDMSIVGPRPERKELIEEYTDYIDAFTFRTKVKAGLTGYAQLYGKYNSNPYNKLLFDLMYVQKFSLLLDFQLILLTLKIIFIKESTDGVDEEFDIFIETFEKNKKQKTNDD